MLLVREVFHCKPGKVKPMVEKFMAMSALNEKLGMGKSRVLTDFAGDRYWTIISEWEVGEHGCLRADDGGRGAERGGHETIW